MVDVRGFAVRVASTRHRPEQIMAFLRQWTPPIVARVEDDATLFDVRTVLKEEEKEICSALAHLSRQDAASSPKL